MHLDRSTKVLLLMIVVALSAIAVHPYVVPSSVQAHSGSMFYVEPGVMMLRAPDGSQQVSGKVMIDMRNGNVWGFPTFTDAPYPVSATTNTPPASHPFLLANSLLPT